MKLKFESFKEEVVCLERFLLRQAMHFLWATSLFLVPVLFGVTGFYYSGDLTVEQAVINTFSVLGAVDLPYPLQDTAGRIFTAVFGLLTQTVFFVALALFLSPLLHRVLHHWHLDRSSSDHKRSL